MNTSLIISKQDNALDTIRVEIERDPRLKSVNSRRGYLHDLSAFEDWRQSRPMTKLLVEEYAAHLQQENKSPSTINRILASVRWWARRVADMAFESPMSKEQREEIVTQAARVASIEDVKGTRPQKGRHIADKELEKLMVVCDESATGIRDAAIIALAWATGARRSELAGLKLDDYKPTSDSEGDLIIKGKGDKVRTLYIYNGAAAALSDWLKLRGNEPGPLFYAINKGGNIQFGHGVSDEAIAQMLAKRMGQAGVSNLTWHDFRRTFAGNLLDDGNDISTVQKLMGHSSPVTTSNYDRRGEDTKRKALKRLAVPYKR